ncbi:MAG: alpha/beta hydrolase [Betaproteobacteria bacterium]|nr:alpha/beta hydrolase [Betaproteobacteria bacterium]
MAGSRELVVLVHGLWVHGLLMELQRRYLARAGFDAVSYSYPSMRLTLTENADRLARFARSLAAPCIHWVGHSLGGLVILRMLEREPALPPGCVVLLGVPYRDSYAGRALARNVFGARALGRSIREWLDSKKPAQFPGRKIGVIAGSIGVGLGRVVARGLPAPNDGVVTVAETELEAACDRIVLPVNHTGMLLSRRVARQTEAFLRDGRFDCASGEI